MSTAGTVACVLWNPSAVALIVSLSKRGTLANSKRPSLPEWSTRADQ